MTLDVIGGKADATKLEVSRVFVVSQSIMGDKYIAIEFPVKPNDKSRMITIYMLAGMKPIDAMMIWRTRNQ